MRLSKPLLEWVRLTVGRGPINRWQVAAKARDFGLCTANHLFGTQHPSLIADGATDCRLTDTGWERSL